MYARITLLEIDTVRVSLDEALRMFREMVVPSLQAQPGYRGVEAFSNPDGKAMLVSFWETAEQADAEPGSGWYDDVLASFATLFRSPPGRERYELRLTDRVHDPVPAAAQ